MVDLPHVDWGTLEHAYGPAGDIPGLLDALRSAELHARATAMRDLYVRILHQGSLYPASVAAIAPLIELAASRSVPERHEILLLVGQMVRAISESDVFPGSQGPDTVSPASPNETRAYTTLASGIRAAVTSHLPRVRDLLEDFDPAVRQAAAYVFAALEERAEDTRAMLRERVEREPDVETRAGLLLCLGVLGEPGAPDEEMLRQVFEQSLDDATRLASAIALAQLSPATVSVDDVAVLADHFDTDSAVITLYADLATLDDSDVPFAGKVLSRIGPLQRSSAIPRLLQRLKNSEGIAAVEVAETLLYLAWPDRDEPGGGITKERWSILDAIAHKDDLWSYSFGVPDALDDLDLPAGREELHEFVQENIGSDN